MRTIPQDRRMTLAGEMDDFILSDNDIIDGAEAEAWADGNHHALAIGCDRVDVGLAGHRGARPQHREMSDCDRRVDPAAHNSVARMPYGNILAGQ